MDMSASGWGTDCIYLKLSHKPSMAGLGCGGWQYNKRKLICLLYLYTITLDGVKLYNYASLLNPDNNNVTEN